MQQFNFGRVGRAIAAGVLAMLASEHAFPSVITFADSAQFESALDASFTRIETAGLIGQRTITDISPTVTGADFFGPDAIVRSDNLILNGSFFHPSQPHVGLNFNDGVDGVGVTSNAIDGGRIQLFSGLSGGGSLIAEVGFGGASVAAFTGVISTDRIRSAIFTCDFNFDLACGLRDPSFGEVVPVTAVPVPLPGGLLLLGLAGLALLRSRGAPGTAAP